MTTLVSIVCLILCLVPVGVLLCLPKDGIGSNQPDPRSWPEIATTALIRLVVGAAFIYGLYWLGSVF